MINRFHMGGALIAGLAPLVLFIILSYQQTVRRAETDLRELAGLAVARAEEILEEAELELTRFAQVTDGRITLSSQRLLREIVYTNPYFREAAFINLEGFLVYTTVQDLNAPIRTAPERRADPSVQSMQVIGLRKSEVMQETSVVISLPIEQRGEVNLLADPAILSIVFHDVDLGPDGALWLTGPGGRVLSIVGEISPEDGPGPYDLRVESEGDERRVSAVAQTSLRWALRDWSSNLMFALPVSAASCALLAFVVSSARRQRSGLDHDLRLGIGRNELRLEYQPIVDLSTGRCVASEALVRWRHPLHGDVSPEVFVPIAQETGLIGRLTEWVIETALREQRPLLDRFPDLAISVNCPASLLVSREMDVILDRLQVPPQRVSRLVLEFTEQVFADIHGDKVKEAMARLSHRGLRFALDDFGAGYSGFGHLQRFELRFDFLKIDRSFVQSASASSTDLSIFGTLVELAQKLSLSAVAEGVETADQRRLVEGCGLVLAQGWLFAPSLPINDFARVLDRPLP